VKELRHPNIVELLDFGTDGRLVDGDRVINGPVYQVFEFISECPLLSLVTEIGAFDEEVACYFFR